MSTIKETTLHPDGNEGVDLYPKTNINQVQELPQKLTSVENQISQLNTDKLTKPTNPSAESAVTMLADGTVGTKPLSEIGGNLYRHDLFIRDNTNHLYTTIYTTTKTKITLATLHDYISAYNYTNIGATSDTSPATVVSFGIEQRDTLRISMVVGLMNQVDFVPTYLEDTVTEL